MKPLLQFAFIIFVWLAAAVCPALEAAQAESPQPASDPAPLIKEAPAPVAVTPTPTSEPAPMAETESPPTPVTFLKSEKGLLIKLGNGEPFSFSPSASPLTQGGISLKMNNSGMVINAETQNAVVQTDLAEGWQITIPKKNGLQVDINTAKLFFDLRTPESNKEKLEIKFADGAKAVMGGKSFARYDHYLDATYCFTARGQVEGETADGMKMKFSPNMPPMFGGPFVESVDEKGGKKKAPGTPVLPLIVNGDPNQTLNIRVHDAQVDLVPNEPKVITDANGSEFTFRHNLSKATLEWSVSKGVGNMTVTGMDCWKAMPVSEQSGVCQWGNSVMDLRNWTKTASFEPVQTALIQINGRVYASVGPSAMFQYAKMRDCGSFATSAYGGEVMLYNTDTRELTSLAQKNLLFEAGSPFKLNDPSVKKEGTALRLTWESDTSIFLRGEGSTIEVKANKEGVLVIGDNELAIQYNDKGELDLRAKIGGFQIKPDFVEDFTISIPQGTSAKLNLQRKNFIFTVQKGDQDNTFVGISTTAGFASSVGNSDTVTLVLGQHNFVEAGSGSGNNATWMFFNGNIGATSFGLINGNSTIPSLTRPPIVDLRTTTVIDRVPLNVVSGQ